MVCRKKVIINSACTSAIKNYLHPHRENLKNRFYHKNQKLYLQSYQILAYVTIFYVDIEKIKSVFDWSSWHYNWKRIIVRIVSQFLILDRSFYTDRSCGSGLAENNLLDNLSCALTGMLLDQREFEMFYIHRHFCLNPFFRPFCSSKIDPADCHNCYQTEYDRLQKNQFIYNGSSQ